MVSVRSNTSEAFLLHARPYRETGFLCDLLSLKVGRVRCHFKGSHPEPYRRFELKLVENKGFISASDYRYLDSLLIRKNDARLYGLYVNELIYRLLPVTVVDDTLYGCYMSTLIHLEQGESIQAALRYFEKILLVTLGRSIDYSFLQNLEAISKAHRYCFVPDVGFVVDPNGRYSGGQILAVATNEYSISGALTVARECQQQQIDSILGDQVIESRTWPLVSYPSNKDKTQ